MPIKIQSDLPVKEILEQENIFVMDDTRAMHQDIRPIQILILNLMPLKEETELQLLRSLSNTPLQIDVTFMAVASHEAKNTSRSHLNKFYETFSEVKHRKFDGMIITGAPVEQSFKTLVAQGKSKEYYVLVIPIAEEVDLKKAAKVLGEKSIEMIHVKDITKVTGYVRGGCSPLGMKKLYPTIIQESAETFDMIYVSGGRIGSTIKVNPQELARVVNAKFADFIVC